jgi:endonuclease VIII
VPEGDTIHRTAATLRAAVGGRPMTRFETPRRARSRTPRPGEQIAAVDARGKHLLIGFSGGLTLHTHMRMGGSWHLYRPGERWQRPRGQVVAVVATAEAEAVCFNAPVVEVLDERELARHPILAALGPDLCLPDPDLDEICTRLSKLEGSTTVADALLDQSIAAGIGNVYKSETLWATGVSPFVRIDEVNDGAMKDLYATAGRLLRANLTREGSRSTVPHGLAVYGRAGLGCPRCETRIVTSRRGQNARSTWWCPACQTDGR